MRRRRFLAGVGTVAAAALAGCFGGPNRELPAAPSGTWRQHAADTANTAATAATVPPRGNPAWDEGDVHTAAPLALDDTVLAPGNRVELLDGRTGETRWETDLDESVDHTPAATNDRVVVPAVGRVVALSLEDGAELWSTPLARQPRGSVTVHADAGLVTVPVRDVGLTAFDLASGENLWTEELIRASPAAVVEETDSSLLCLTGYRPDDDTGVLRGLNPDGTRQWSVTFDSPDTAPVVIEDGLLVSDDGTLTIHNPTDGSRKRTVGTFGDQVNERLAVADGITYVVSDYNDLIAVNLADGTEMWRADVSVIASAGPSVGAETVVVGARKLPEASLGGILALDRSDGSSRWGHEIEGFDIAVSAPPVVADGAVYYSSNESIGIVALGDLPPLETETDGSQ